MPFLALFLTIFLLIPSLAVASAEEETLRYIERGDWARMEKALLGLRDPVLRDVAVWYELTQNKQMSLFADYKTFLHRHPDWPQQDKLYLRAELSLLNGFSQPSTIAAWLKTYPPRTARGKFFIEELNTKGNPSPAAIKAAWIQGDFPEVDQKRFLLNYRAQLTQADHIARTDRLLWEGQVDEASEMLIRLPPDEVKMFQTRIALIKRKGNFDALLAQVPPRLKNAPGLLFERMRFRFDKKMYDGVEQLLLIAPKNPPYPAKWWPYRRYCVREALDEKDYKLAFKLAEAHGQIDKIELSEALWLKAWVELVFLKRPQPALADFTRMFDKVEFPVSKSRAAYWVARAAQAGGDIKKSREWLQRAALYPTTFYGQIAFQELYGNQPLVLPAPSATITDQEWQALYKSSSLAQAVIQLDRFGYDHLALPFLTHLAQTAKTPKMAAFAAHTGWRTGRADLGVRAAKEALNAGYYLPDYLFPIDMTPPKLALEPALAYAITRQESMFYPKARSSADARGMMQILPSTGRLVAAKHDLSFSPDKLFEQDYNFILGSYYLDSLLKRFDGAKVLAIAGYNAGPGRPGKWVQKYGALTNDRDHNIDWIERIPFAETRNYVQRVLENYQVYRVLLAKEKPPLTAKEALAP